jgi:hypothetical protein
VAGAISAYEKNLPLLRELCARYPTHAAFAEELAASERRLIQLLDALTQRAPGRA